MCVIGVFCLYDVYDCYVVCIVYVGDWCVCVVWRVWYVCVNVSCVVYGVRVRDV
jgi:hypothetical protein